MSSEIQKEMTPRFYQMYFHFCLYIQKLFVRIYPCGKTRSWLSDSAVRAQTARLRMRSDPIITVGEVLPASLAPPAVPPGLP